MKVRHAPKKGEATEKAAQLRSDLELAIADADAAERKESILQTLDEERAGVELRMRAAGAARRENMADTAHGQHGNVHRRAARNRGRGAVP